jgi:hypothetical protein
MKQTYRVLALLIALGVVVQAMSIALGWFLVLKDVDDGAVYTKDTDYNFGQIVHATVGTMVIPLLALVLLIISFFAGIAGGVKWAAMVFGLVVLQFLLALLSFGAPAVGALHGLNALALMAVAGLAGRRAADAQAPAVTDTEAATQPPAV